jgi:hypothetical protein
VERRKGSAMTKARRSLSPFIAALLVSTGLTAALYWRTLALPFYSDDLLQILWVKATSLLDIWRSAGPYGDYRPLQFSMWRLVYLLTGDLQSSLLHAMNLVGHAVCGTLVGVLAARRTEQRALSAALAAALFIAFPFAFDVVAWAVSFSYPLAMSFALGSVLLYLRARERSSVPQHIVAIALSVLAALAYEPAVIAVATILLAEATIIKKRDLRWPAVYIVASALAIVPILAFSPARAEPMVAAVSGDTIVIALQAFAYPLAPLAAVARRIGISPALTTGALALGCAALLGLGYAARKAGRLRWFLFGLGWAVLWSAIPLVTQQFGWTRDPPRVLYPSAVGVAILWGTGLLALVPLRLGTLRYPALLALAAATLVPALIFVNSTMALYRRAGDLLWNVIRLAGDGQPTLFVNLPGRITPPERLYFLGHEGVIPLPPPSNAELLVEANVGREGAALERSAGAMLPSLPYGVELAGPPISPEDIRASGRVVLTKYRSDGSMTLEEAGAILPPVEPRAAQARFGADLLLLTAECRRDGGDRVILTTTWHALEPIQGLPTVFAHLLGGDGALATQADGDPIRGLYPLALWRPGETVRDNRVFEDVPTGPTSVILGVWEPEAGTRWTATDGGGIPLPDHAFRCEVEMQ